jgi:hypothetical protein
MFNWLRRALASFREVCPHCGAVGWGNSIGCSQQWQDYAANSIYVDFDDDPDEEMIPPSPQEERP